jgi:hypothetical protein
VTREARPRRSALWLALPLVAASGLALQAKTGGTAHADPPAGSASAAAPAGSAPSPSPCPSVSPTLPACPAPLSPAAQAAVDDFLAVARVLHSPRCQNCHPSDDNPRIGDAGRKHRMNLSRHSPDAGLPCTTCHRSHNTPFAHGPPGVPGWRMPPAERPLVFAGRSPRELCEQLKDPARNGGKSLQALREHLASDPLVLWGWSPGPGRTLPPMPHAELVKHADDWIAAGAPCPR